MYACVFVPVIDCTCVMSRTTCRCQADPVFWASRFIWCVYWPVSRCLEVTWLPLSFKLGRGFMTLSHQTLLNEGRQCCESWRDAELRVRAVCAVGDRLETCGESGSESPSDTTGEDLVLVHWVILLCFSPHRNTAMGCLTNYTLTTSSSNTDCYDDWHQTSPTVRRPSYNVSSPFLYCRLYAIATTRLLLCTCCLSLAMFLGDILGCILCYRLLFPVYLSALSQTLYWAIITVFCRRFTIYIWSLLFSSVLPSLLHSLYLLLKLSSCFKACFIIIFGIYTVTYYQSNS